MTGGSGVRVDLSGSQTDRLAVVREQVASARVVDDIPDGDLFGALLHYFAGVDQVDLQALPDPGMTWGGGSLHLQSVHADQFRQLRDEVAGRLDLAGDDTEPGLALVEALLADYEKRADLAQQRDPEEDVEDDPEPATPRLAPGERAPDYQRRV